MLIKIFSYLSYDEALKIALVCKIWRDAARLCRFDLLVKKITLTEWKEFLNIFPERDVTLPFRCLQIQDVDDKILMTELTMQEYENIKITIIVTKMATEAFLKFIKTVPEKFNIIWNVSYVDDSEFQKHWLNICNVAEVKGIEIALHAVWSPNELRKILSIFLIQAPPKQIFIEKWTLNKMDLTGFEPIQLKNFLKKLKFVNFCGNESNDFELLNMFLGSSVTHFTLELDNPKDYKAKNILELLPNLQKNIEVSKDCYPFLF